MRKIPFLWYAMAFLLVGGILVAIDVPVVWSTSVDLAHHYSLIFRLSENSLLAPDDPTLGEMNVYPRGSHLAAVFVARLVGSPFLGMHVVALIALVTVWASCLAILYAAPNRTGPFNATAMALVVVLNFGAFRIHGSEISNNYFFAQLVAQALAMAAIATSIRLEARHGRVSAFVVLLGAAWLLTGVHLLPAVELLALLAGLLVVDVAFIPAPPRKRLRRALLACIVVGFGIAVIVWQPAFAAMRNIANNNGDIRLGPLAPLWSVGVTCVIALGCSVGLVRTWRRDPIMYVMYKYLGVYGAAVSGLCLLQTMLSFFHIGSDYAAKKYAYAVVTFLFMRLALWLGDKATVVAARPRFARLVDHPAFAVYVFAGALFATVSGAAKIRHDIDTRAVVSLEHQLTHLPSTALLPPATGKQNLVLELRGVPTVVNYMFSLSIARTSREAALLVLHGQSVNAWLPWQDLGTILTAPGNVRFAAAASCSTTQSRDLVAIDAMCVGKPKIAVLATQSQTAR